MASAAIYFNPEAYGTAGAKLMGRHSAGEGFLAGLIAHGEPGPLTLWNYWNLPPDKLRAAISDLCGDRRQVRVLAQQDRRGLSGAGAVSLPTPVLGKHAWNRRHLGDAAYSLCGVTHTTVSQLDDFVELALAPVQPWDAVVVTSRAVQASLEEMYAALGEHLRDRLGAQRLPLPQLPVIPLGVDCGRFTRSDAARREWRDRLGIAEDDVVVLYVGRFDFTSKMNPAVMAMVLERAAQRTGRRVHWVLAGWAADNRRELFEQSIFAQALSLQIHLVDGRPQQTRRSIWSVADLFISLSDNVQETFGLTPVEAMAAGLPSVISDWNGYRDTVRHEIDGFRIPTVVPTPGLGRDLALGYAQGWSSYDSYIASASQFTAVDVEAAVSACLRLIDDAELRARMGEAARRRAQEVFDWSQIIPQYEALWGELGARRAAAAAEKVRGAGHADNPWRLDPFRMYAGYATARLSRTSLIAGVPGMTWDQAERVLAQPLVRMAPHLLPTTDEVRQLLEWLAGPGALSLDELLDGFPPARRLSMQRGVVWMGKYGLLRILPS